MLYIVVKREGLNKLNLEAHTVKLMESTKNGMIEIKTITTIKNLENYQIVMMERGDKMKKVLKKSSSIHGHKGHYSVKTINSAISETEAKLNKKNNAEGGLCCVCTDWFANLDSNGRCQHCQL